MDKNSPIYRETNATLKRVLCEMEELAELPPLVAVEPIAFNARRAKVARAIWNLVKLAVRNGSGELLDR